MVPRFSGTWGATRPGLRACHGSQLARCWCGENGKRGGPSNLWAQALVGSNPATSTAAPCAELTGIIARAIVLILEGSPRGLGHA